MSLKAQLEQVDAVSHVLLQGALTVILCLYGSVSLVVILL